MQLLKGSTDVQNSLKGGQAHALGALVVPPHVFNSM